MMKASIGRLRRFALHKVDANDIGELFPTGQIEGLARAAKDMQDMRECYDRLLSVAAATANSAYEFSESLGEMGSCLEQIAHNDEESGRILLSLGKVQFELQRLVDNYRSHIFKTITRPSESLLNDLITVEDMKQQCEEKRDLVKQMMMEHVKDKVQRKGSKGERLVRRQLETARDELQDEATLCIFRLKSLKEGQARSLLTQAARHHTAQMQLFFAGLKSLEAVEQHVRVAAERQHIDRKLSDHENEMESSDHDEHHHLNRDGELSFDYITNEQRVGAISTPRTSTKIDDMDLSFPRPSPTRSALVNASDHTEDHQIPIRDRRMSSYSAPLLPEKESDSSERLKQMNPSVPSSANAYVLPTPSDSRHSIFTKPTSNPSSKTHIGNLWHSSPLEPMNNTETNLHTRLPRPQHHDSIDVQKTARLAFSGPLKPSVLEKSPTATRLPVPVQSPRLSPTASPPLASPPRLNELHQLPRPPGQSTPPPRRTKSPVLIGHSAPLTTWNQERNSAATTATPVSTNIIASPLPIPPLIVSRSFSIPSRDHRISSSTAAATDRTEDRVASPPPPHPLTPVSLMNLRSLPRSQPLPQVAGVAQNGQFRGGVKLIER